MDMKPGNLLMVILAIAQESIALTLSDTKIRLVLYTTAQTWNEAQRVCDMNNGTLYTQDSAERGLVLAHYEGSADWTAKRDVWVGLHYPAGESGAVYGWTSCQSLNQTQYDAWKNNEPVGPDSSRCGKMDKVHLYWIADVCSNANYFLCEFEGAACTYRQTQQIPIGSAVYNETTSTETSMSDCWAKCLIETHNDKNCWAVNWESGATPNCRLYFQGNPFYFDDSSTLQSSASRELLIKECYSFLENSTAPSVPPEPSSDPSEGCSSFDPTTTTTITATTTRTTTTTTQSATSSPTTSSTPATPVASTTTSSTTSTHSASTSSTTSTSTTSVSPLTSTTTPPTSTSSATSANTPSTTVPSFILCYNSDFVTPEFLNLTLDQKVEVLQQRLKLDKTSLSATVRKKTSAKDDRVEAQSVGYVGVIFLCLMFGPILLADAGSLLLFLYNYLTKRPQVTPADENTTISS